MKPQPMWIWMVCAVLIVAAMVSSVDARPARRPVWTQETFTISKRNR